MPPTRRRQPRRKQTRRIGGDPSTKYVAMDCEMVQAGKRVLLAEVALVNWHGETIYHSYVKPGKEVITDYRYEYSGITPEKLKTGQSFTVVQKAVLQHLQGKILVGHSLENDLKALRIDHPFDNIQDIATMPVFMTADRKRRKLKTLMDVYFKHKIQQEHHDATEDAFAAIALFRLSQKWLEEGVHL